MKRFRFWQFAIIITVGFTLVAIGTHWFINNPSEEVGANLSVGIAEADFRLPEYEGDLFTPQKAVYDGDKLVLTLRSNVLYPEPFEEFTLTKGSEQWTAEFGYTTDGDLRVVVTNPPANIDGAVLKLPAVSIERESSISVDFDSDTFTGPGDETYRFTHRGANSDTGQERLIIDYEPDEPDAPSISSAMIQVGEDSFYAVQAGGKLDASKRFIFGQLVFPSAARALMERDGVELVITMYSEIVTDSITIPAGLISTHGRNSTSTAQ